MSLSGESAPFVERTTMTVGRDGDPTPAGARAATTPMTRREYRSMVAEVESVFPDLLAEPALEASVLEPPVVERVVAPPVPTVPAAVAAAERAATPAPLARQAAVAPLLTRRTAAAALLATAPSAAVASPATRRVPVTAPSAAPAPGGARRPLRLRARWEAFTDPTHPFPAHPWTIILPAVGVVGVIVLLVTALLRSVGPVDANLGAAVVDGSTASAVVADGVSAEVTAPAGWTVTTVSDGVLRVTSPDGALRVDIRPAAAAADDTLRALLAGTDAGHPAVVSETLADGLAVEHADVGGEILAAVALTPTTSVAVTARVTGSPMALYRPAFAAVLAGIGS